MSTYGAEQSNTCGLHFGAVLVAGDCPLCQMAGLKVVVCDPLEIERVLRAMDVVGASYVAARSRAVLTFTRPAGAALAGDVMAKKPGARVNGASLPRANGRASA